MRVRDVWLVAAGLVLFAAGPADAQRRPRGSQPAKAAAPVPEPELKFEREIYLYPVDNRRDPMTSLAATSDMGPRFEDLSLDGIIYSSNGESVVLLSDPGGRPFRVRRGEAVGNARVVSIAPRNVLFAVQEFGIVRHERLELKRKETEGENP